MKGFATAFLLFTASAAFAQVPDPRDSIILESKTVLPNLNGTPAFVMRVYITNKDSLTFMTLALRESTIVGTAYALMSTPRTFAGVVNPLSKGLRFNPVSGFVAYDNKSPDRFLLAAGFDAAGDPVNTIEPPNLTRKPIWEIKFNHSTDSLGQIRFDTLRFVQSTGFTNTVPRDVKANFVPSIITVGYIKGDLDRTGDLAPADVVLNLRGVFLGIPPPIGLEACDLNCDGERTLADVMDILNLVFLEEPLPC